MKFLSLVIFLSMILVASSPVKAQKREAGLLLNAKGGISVTRNGKTLKEKAHSLTVIYESDILSLAKEAKCQVVLSAGTRFMLASGSRIKFISGQAQRLQGTPPKLMSPIGKNLASYSSELKDSLRGRLGGIVLRGNQSEIGLRDPITAGVVKSKGTILSWLGEAKGDIVLHLKESGSGEDILVKTLKHRTRSFQIPEGLLKPGVWYDWRVAAENSKDDSEVCGASIRVQAPEDAAKKAQLEKEAKSAMKENPKDPAPHLLLAMAYEALGLFHEAGVEYDNAQQLDPDDKSIEAALTRLKR